jgi:hypothetical protein
MSAKHNGRSSMRFFCTDKTLSAVSFASSGGRMRSLLRLISRISREDSSQIYIINQPSDHEM